MAITVNTTHRNTMLDGIDATYNSATLTVRSGAAPGAGSAAAGTVLATVTLPADAFAAASGGTKAKAGTWSDASADATGTAAHFRAVATGGEIFEGTVTVTGGGGDLQLASVALVAGVPFTITSFNLSLSNGS